jgi:glycyl-tRNA synthetase beta chain
LSCIEIIERNQLRFSIMPPAGVNMALVAASVNGAEWARRFDDLVRARIAAGDPMSKDEMQQAQAEIVARAKSPEELEKFRVRVVAAKAKLLDFFADRLKVQQREAGVRHDLIDAVFALGGEDDLVRLLARVKALQAFVETDDGANLLAGYRRAANILKAEAKKDGAEPQPFSGFTYEPDAAEAALAQVLDTQLPVAEQAIVNEDFAAAMTALSVIRPTIDAFFDDVTVNSQDETKRITRLALLDKLRAAMQKVADFSKIEG